MEKQPPSPPPPVTLESLDKKVDDLTADVADIRTTVTDRIQAALDRVAQGLRDTVVEEIDSRAERRHTEAMNFAREATSIAKDNHRALITKITETVEAAASRSEVAELRGRVEALERMLASLLGGGRS